MKRFSLHHGLLAALVLLTGGNLESSAIASGPRPTETVLLISESIPEPGDLLAAITHHLNTATPGSRVHVVHGGHSLASFWVPNGTSQTRYRSRYVASAWAKIQQLLKRPTEGSDQINLPNLATAINSRRDTKLPLRVSIYGSPLYLDPNKQAYNHEGKFVTADNAIDVPPSPWRTKVKLPGDTLVTWITPNALFGYDSVHRQWVNRFNALFIQELGGQLIRTSDKPELLFNHFSPEPIEQVDRIASASNTRIQRSEDSIIPGGDPTSPFILDQELMGVTGREATDTADRRQAMIAEALRDANRVMVIINWESDDPHCDLDMWLTSNGLEGEVNHANPKLPWAELTRDIQHTEHASGKADVEKHEGVLIKHGRIEDLTLWINVYRTQAPARVTITRIWNRERKSRTVEIKTVAGDGGRYQRFRVGSTAWKRVNLVRFSTSNLPGDI